MSTEVGSPGLPHRGHIPGLDGIRGLAIGLVLFSHSVIYDGSSSIRPIGFHAGYIGVSIFFVLSGYLITTVLLREEERTGGISLRLFYLRRALRLFPALWLYLLVVGAIWLAGGLPYHPWHSFVSSLLYLRNLVGRGHETDHLWSLSIEEQFYLVWPLVMIMLRCRHRARLFIALAVLIGITLWRIYAARTGLASAGDLYIRSDFRFDSPLFGCVLALAQRVPWGTRVWTNSTALRNDLMTLVGVVGLALWVGLGMDEVVYPGTDATAVCMLGVALVMSQTGVRGWLSNAFTWPPLVALGQVSYGIYLWQQLFLGPRSLGFEGIRVFPLGMLATFAVALASFWCLEKPLLRLKDRKFNGPSRGGGAVTGSSPGLQRTAAVVYAATSRLRITTDAPSST
jgi:peptidoglycan/LPS O-acetylase OafA/YrhL